MFSRISFVIHIQLCLSITTMYTFLCTYTSTQTFTLAHLHFQYFHVRLTCCHSYLFPCVSVTHKLLSSYCTHPDCVFEVVLGSFYEFVFMFVPMKLTDTDHKNEFCIGDKCYCTLSMTLQSHCILNDEKQPHMVWIWLEKKYFI